MNKLIIVISFSFLCIYSYAQERFYNLYDGWCIGGIHIAEDNYIARGLKGHPTTSSHLLQFNIISFDGTLLDSFAYLNDTSDGMTGRVSRNYLFTGDKVIFSEALVSYFKDYTVAPSLLFYDFSQREMDTILTYTHCINEEGLNYLLDSIEAGLIITGNYRYENSNYFPIIYFTDSVGDTLSVKKYSFTPNAIRRMLRPYQLLKLPDGGFLMSCQDEVGSTDAYHADIQRSCFLRLDNEGNELWRSYTTNTDTITFHPFAALMPDGNYLIAWSDPFLADAPNPNSNLWLARMTDNGFIYGKKKASSDIDDIISTSYFINDMYQDENGNVYLTGEKWSVASPSFLIKINPLGIAEWYREYECFPDDDAQATYTKIYGITPTEDGGFIMGGEYFCSPSTIFPSGTQQGLVIKVDSMGCLEEGCGTTDIRHTINALNAEIYPNPASEKITFTLAEQTNAAKIKIYDAKGCLWVNIGSQGVTQSHTLTNTQTGIEMDVSQLPAGIYTVNIWAEGKFYVGKFAK